MQDEATRIATDLDIASVEEKIEEAVEEIKEDVEQVEQTEAKTLAEAIADEVVSRIKDELDRFYDKMKQFIVDILDAADDAMEVTQTEEVAAPVEETEEEQQEDIKPRRSHRLFRKPFRKED